MTRIDAARAPRRTARSRILVALAAAAAVATVLSGCGTTEAATTGSGSSGASLTITDATGTRVKLDGPAKRTIGTEWNVVEQLVTLGVDPVGVADIAGYESWDAAVKLPGSPRDIGTRGEPSLDTVAALRPDLIVATTDLSSASIRQLRRIAPVLVVRSADGAGQIDQMLTNLDLIAKATGRTAEAKAQRADFEAKLARGKAALADAGLSGARYAFADGYVEGNQLSIRPYTSTSLIGEVSERLGLKTAWTMKGDKAYGLAQTDVEGLTSLGDAQFLYIGNKADGDDPFAVGLKDNPVWTGLPFVQNGHVHRLPDGIWMFGGTGSMGAYVDAVVAALTR